ncbi:hypothetical protein GH714_022477 [Hevea brasiliensis]|uniref:Uncharacterized protein n=1 Tax=Hevea brasiliensis TaxID=3981 RepID=A0A6A6LZL6_HEVBR|nr:hypothetical protein GH714_022477 [Hevea brasiliensis]
MASAAAFDFSPSSGCLGSDSGGFSVTVLLVVVSLHLNQPSVHLLEQVVEAAAAVSLDPGAGALSAGGGAASAGDSSLGWAPSAAGFSTGGSLSGSFVVSTAAFDFSSSSCCFGLDSGGFSFTASAAGVTLHLNQPSVPLLEQEVVEAAVSLHHGNC